MSKAPNSIAEKNPVFQLKGGLFTLTTLQLVSNDLSLIKQHLEQKISEAPKFFQNAPLVIDLQKMNRSTIGNTNNNSNGFDFKLLKEILQSKELIPVGIKGGSQIQQEAAAKAGFALLPESTKEINEEMMNSGQTQANLPQIDKNDKNGKSQTSAQTSANTVKTAEGKLSEGNIRGSNTKVITEPVRSGQQYYARGGDLIVLSPVSHGAELLADGHIHVYGPLRGRALAGVTGDTSAHIFCQSLEAELISIAGNYKISEDIDKAVWRLAVDIYFVDGRLHIQPL